MPGTKHQLISQERWYQRKRFLTSIFSCVTDVLVKVANVFDPNKPGEGKTTYTFSVSVNAFPLNFR
jgi:hypothetical protein